MNDPRNDIAKELIANREMALHFYAGKHATPYFDELYARSKSLPLIRSSMEVLQCLLETDKAIEAIKLIHILYALLGLDYPVELEDIAQNSEWSNFYLKEFLADLDDICEEEEDLLSD
jgi:hypothetical protein